MGLREKQTSERRERILDAARALIRRSGTDFSMKALADAAEVSLATPYNLFGSKGGVLYALLNDSLDRVDDAIHTSRAREPRDPVEGVLEVAGLAASVYASDSAFYRPLMQFLLGVRDLSHRPRFLARSIELWTRTVAAARSHEVLEVATNDGLLARQLMINFAGVLELWIHEELDDRGFRSQILFGSTMLLLGASRPASRPRLLRRLDEIGKTLPRKLGSPPATTPRTKRRQRAA